MSSHICFVFFADIKKAMCSYLLLLFLAAILRHLTLKMPRKSASENVVCLCCLLNILANFFCIQANSVDPDQTAPRLLKSQADDKSRRQLL